MAMHKQIISRLFFLFLILLTAVPPASARPPQVPVSWNYAVGSIIVKTAERKLLYVRAENDIQVYPIAVGRQGRKWSGVTTVSRKVRNPTWAPPAFIRRENPKLPALIPPGPNNPLGVAVLVLGDGTYGIHGTNRDGSIGTDASYGCIRMYNADILDLFKQVGIGTVVYVQQ